jgi:hypothetical protein
MAAYDTGKMILFIHSILWDLGIPLEAATVLYEDNNACTAMGNAQKPTPHTRHIDIKYFSICEWIERDLMILELIDTTSNMSDHFTKRSITGPISLTCGLPTGTYSTNVLANLQVHYQHIYKSTCRLG